MAQSLDPLKNRCSIWYHASTLKGDTLFINGGLETFMSGDSDEVLRGFNEDLISVDMSKSWDAQYSLPASALPKTVAAGIGSTPPSLVQGALFQGSSQDSLIFAYAGTTPTGNTSFPGYMPNNPKGAALFAYDLSSKGWFQFSQDNTTYRPSFGAAAEAPELGLGFYFNGQIDVLEDTVMGKDKTPVEGMTIVDTGNHNTRNVSTTAFTAGNTRRGASMQYVSSIGAKGSLVLLGGIAAGTPQQNDGWPDFEVDMSRVDLFDVASLDQSPNSGTWYTQTATGDIPAKRIDFCLVAVAAKDGSSHNVYLFGGREPFFNTPFDDVYVLSLPSYTWTLLYNGTNPRFGQTCHLAGNRYLLSVGGSLTSDQFAILNLPYAGSNATLNTTTAHCDQVSNGVSLFDLTDIAWGTKYDPNAPAYGVPQKVVSKIGGSPTGGATMASPSGGFAQQGLAAVFKASKSSTSSSPSPSASAASTSSSTNTGAIVGGVVGGVGGLLLIAAIAFFCLRRHKRSRKSQQKDLPALEIDGDTKKPPELDSPKDVKNAASVHPAYRSSNPDDPAYRNELAGADAGVYEKGDHDMWENKRRVYGNGNGTGQEEDGAGLHEKEGDGEMYRDDQAKRTRGERGELYGSDVNELDGSTEGARTVVGSPPLDRSEWGSPVTDRAGVHEMPDSTRYSRGMSEEDGGA